MTKDCEFCGISYDPATVEHRCRYRVRAVIETAETRIGARLTELEAIVDRLTEVIITTNQSVSTLLDAVERLKRDSL